MRKLTPLLAALALCAVAHAQPVPANVGELKLNPSIPAPGVERIETDLVPRTTVSPAPVAANAVPAPVVGEGVPRIPGAGDAPTPATSPTAGAANLGQPAAPAQEPLTKNFVAGEPVPTYATMRAAADAGIEPLPALQLEAPEPLPGFDLAEKAFDWKSPHAYLQWFQANPADAMLYGGGGLFVLIAAGWIVLRRGIGRG